MPAIVTTYVESPWYQEMCVGGGGGEGDKERKCMIGMTP